MSRHNLYDVLRGHVTSACALLGAFALLTPAAARDSIRGLRAKASMPQAQLPAS